ncbi:hypothetical protein GRF61_00435 [Azoarcus sp. TTM-91]|uniref:hypothetical protein n=1 Tax=Azoarcus sp. TTM-91 TaxID=2691581 RepID=UPI00145E77B5|nr:hypothetical protein [Azoarcus sp. TTM-91]NMG32915.1 hypothetical protein [Azoarcus sp. TTM-91]
MKLVFRQLRGLLALVVMLTASVNAHALLFNIDPSRSSVTFVPSDILICDVNGECPELPSPQTFSLSGTLDYQLRRWEIQGAWVETVAIKPVNVDSHGAELLDFLFPFVSAYVDPDGFSGPHFCRFSTGYCATDPFLTSTYIGFLDGDTLRLEGKEPLNYYEFFRFSVVAQAVGINSVPAPGTLFCLLPGFVALMVMGRRPPLPAASLA